MAQVLTATVILPLELRAPTHSWPPQGRDPGNLLSMFSPHLIDIALQVVHEAQNPHALSEIVFVIRADAADVRPRVPRIFNIRYIINLERDFRVPVGLRQRAFVRVRVVEHS